MKRFFEPNLMTCFKSGLFLFAAALAIIAAAYWSTLVLLTGIIAITAFAFIFGRSLAYAGLDTMLVKLSQFNRIKAVMMIALGIFVEMVLFVFAVPILVSLNDSLDIDLVRLISLAASVTFLPFTIVLVASLTASEA